MAQGNRRERIVLATKLFGPMAPGANNRGLSAYYIRRACEASLKRLQTDHIDLYQMHHVDLGWIAPHQLADVGEGIEFHDAPHQTPGAPWSEIWQAMGGLISRDKISYVGSSNFAAWNIVQACEVAASRGLLGLVSEQSVYSLAKRSVELEVIPACRAYGVGFICWSPLAGGLLASALEKAEKGRRSKLDISDEQKKTLKAYEDLCRDLGQAPAVVALAWLLQNPVVTAPIIGPRTMEQLESAMAALELDLKEDVMKRLDELFPGPGGEAPMAYAW
jgi:aryl-alcohol dehydrogenase-like predicted oxidoreductase